MSPKQSTNKPEARSSKGKGSAVGQASAAQRRFEEIQLARLSARLRDSSNVREVVRGLGGNPDQYISKLAKQYSQLSAKRDPLAFTAQSLSPRLSAILNNLGDLFGWWESVLGPTRLSDWFKRPAVPTPAEASVPTSIRARSRLEAKSGMEARKNNGGSIPGSTSSRCQPLRIRGPCPIASM